MNVQCSWKVADDRQVSEAVVSSNETESADLEDDIVAENCLMLFAPENGEEIYPTIPACQLLISCQPPDQISRISVLSEARIIEVYGHNGEYLKTVKNVLIEEEEEMVVFKGDVLLDRPVSLCSIKFLSLRALNEMWLYGVKIQISKMDYDPQNEMTIPFAALEHRLGDMGLDLSDKAEAFKQLLQSRQKSPILDQVGVNEIVSTLLQSTLFKGALSDNLTQLAVRQKSPLKDVCKRDLENNVSENENYSSRKSVHTASVSTSPPPSDSSSNSTQTDEEYLNLEEKLETFIVNQMAELETNMWEKVNKRFQETEAKILCKLDEIESYVKPQGMQSK